MEYYVYKHTLFDGRTYIGITKQNPPQKRWQNGTAYKGNTYFTRTIEKYGWENFDHEILASKLSEEEAKKLEIELIKKYKSNQRKYGFNISSGGESKSGTTISEEQKEKIRKANIGKVVSTETRKKLSVTSKVRWSNPLYVEHMRKINLGENNPRYGKKMSDEEVIKRAEELGMVMKEEEPLFSSESQMVEQTESQIAEQEESTELIQQTEHTEQTESTEQKTDETQTEFYHLIIPTGTVPRIICKELEENGVIDNAAEFRQYLVEVGYATSIIAGEYDVPYQASYEEIYQILKAGPN